MSMAVRLRAGEWVEVRSLAEILATLDETGCLGALPFMPEMAEHCGKKFRVFKSAHKTCNTLGGGGIRQMEAAVHLDGLRCDGEAHGGCQAGCLLFWKEAWLKRVDAPIGTSARTSAERGGAGRPWPVESLMAGTLASGEAGEGDRRYRCQATELGRATAPARWWDPRLYVRDLLSRNMRLLDVARYALLAAFNVVMRRARLRPYPHVRGLAGDKTPSVELELQPGEWVEVRSKDEIMRTLNPKARNRGLLFDVEMLPFCGRTYRVLTRVERLIDERTGKMAMPRNPCVILEGVTCGGCLSRDRLFCPRSIYPYWHEIWLKRVDTVREPRASTDAFARNGGASVSAANGHRRNPDGRQPDATGGPKYAPPRGG
jgi:hypothetical protein